MTKRMKPAQRREEILQAAMSVARRLGYKSMRRCDVAKEAGVTDALVSNYWGTITQLQRGVMRKAIADDDLELIAQGVVAKDRHVAKLSERRKRHALMAQV